MMFRILTGATKIFLNATSKFVRNFRCFPSNFWQPRAATDGRHRTRTCSEFRSESRLNTFRPFPPHSYASSSSFLLSLPPTFSSSPSQHIRNSDKEGAGRRRKERPPRDYQRGGAGGAREQHQRSSRQINLRRDLRSGTSLSAYIRVYTCARAPAGLACAWPDRTGAGYIVHRE